MPDRTCSIEGCERLHYARGWCNMHYTRWWKHGDPLWIKPLLAVTPDLFWEKVDKAGPLPEFAPHLGPCWLWLGGINNKGYGYTHAKNRQEAAHRYSYSLLVGPPPRRPLCFDHLCRVRACVRPDHLEIVTLGENVLRGMSPSAIKHRERVGR